MKIFVSDLSQSQCFGIRYRFGLCFGSLDFLQRKMGFLMVNTSTHPIWGSLLPLEILEKTMPPFADSRV
jgi:hypothetical protein